MHDAGGRSRTIIGGRTREDRIPLQELVASRAWFRQRGNEVRRIRAVLRVVRLDARLDRAHVRLARSLRSAVLDTAHGEQHDPGEDAEDHDHDHELDEGESLFLPSSLDHAMHSCLLSTSVGTLTVYVRRIRA